MGTGARIVDHMPPPGPIRPQEDHGGGGWAWLVTVRGIIEAELLRGLLETAGITPVHLDATDRSPTSWLFLSGDVNALVRIYVPRALLDEARLTLLADGPQAEDIDVPAPPRPAARWVWIVVAAMVVLVFGWRLFVAACGSPIVC